MTRRQRVRLRRVKRTWRIWGRRFRSVGAAIDFPPPYGKSRLADLHRADRVIARSESLVRALPKAPYA